MDFFSQNFQPNKKRIENFLYVVRYFVFVMLLKNWWICLKNQWVTFERYHRSYKIVICSFQYVHFELYYMFSNVSQYKKINSNPNIKAWL